MRLTTRDTFPSPDRAKSWRVAIGVRRERDAKDLALWFDVPAECQGDVSETGNPWLMLMLPLALASGEDIVLPLPVDPHLLENLQGMMRFWHASYPELKPVHIDAPLCTERPPGGNRRGIFFSGGVDSTFSLLRHDTSVVGNGSGIIDDLIFVAGLDRSASSEVELTGEHLGRVAMAHGKQLVRVSTNLKQLDTPYRTNWLLFYGCVLGTVGHLLDRRYGEIIISSGLCYGDRPPTGSHPVTDPLLSSRQLRFVHEGASFTRVEKIRQIAAAGDPLRSVRVCWESKRHDNCSRCSKCLLTMVILDLAGYRDRAACFDWSSYKVDKLRSLFLDSDIQTIFFQEVLAEARQQGRQDVAQVVAEILGSSLRIRAIVDRVRRTPLLWRFDYQIREFLLGRRRGQDARIRPLRGV